MPAKIYKNTHDWSKDLQQHIDKVFGLDGDRKNLSEEDIQIAQDSYCKDSYNNDTAGQILSTIVCNDKSATGIFSEKAEFLYNLRSFSKDNPIHRHFELESELVTPEYIGYIVESYKLFGQILAKVKEHLQKNSNLPSEEKLKFVYTVMHDLGIKFENQAHPLLLVNLSTKRLNCDTSSFVVMAIAHEFKWIAHEFKWPVHLVAIANNNRGHVFIRWDGKGKHFNIEPAPTDLVAKHPAAVIQPDSYYEKTYGVKKNTLEKHASYPALIYSNIGLALYLQKKYGKAMESYSLAIKHEPAHAVAYVGRATARALKAEYEHAIGSDARKREYKLAIKDYDKAIKINSKFVIAFHGRGLAKANLGKRDDAIKDFKMVVSLNPQFANAWYMLATLHNKVNNLNQACRCINEALELNPNDQRYIQLFIELKCGL